MPSERDEVVRRPAKLGAEKLTPEEQKRRFEELARELECDESEERFDAALRVIGKQKPPATREIKTVEELTELVQAAVRSSDHPLHGSQWVKVVAVDAAVEGAPNWRIAHSGDAGGFSKALDAAESLLQQKFILAQS